MKGRLFVAVRPSSGTSKVRAGSGSRGAWFDCGARGVGLDMLRVGCDATCGACGGTWSATCGAT